MQHKIELAAQYQELQYSLVPLDGLLSPLKSTISFRRKIWMESVIVIMVIEDNETILNIFCGSQPLFMLNQIAYRSYIS